MLGMLWVRRSGLSSSNAPWCWVSVPVAVFFSPVTAVALVEDD